MLQNNSGWCLSFIMMYRGVDNGVNGGGSGANGAWCCRIMVDDVLRLL